MKLTAAFVAAALTASGVRGLPIADSVTNLAARSDIKLDGGVVLQAAKRGTDTDLVTRQINQAQEVLLARDVVQPDSLSKRAPGIVFGKLSQAGDVARDLPISTSAHNSGLPDATELKLPDSAIRPSTPDSNQLIKSPRKSAADQAMEDFGAHMTSEELDHQRYVDLQAMMAINKYYGEKSTSDLVEEAMLQHSYRSTLHDAAYARSQGRGHEMLSGDIAEEETAKAFMKKIAVKPTSTWDELLHHQAREHVTLKAVLNLPKLYKLSKLKRRRLSAAEKQTRDRLEIINELLKTHLH